MGGGAELQDQGNRLSWAPAADTQETDEIHDSHLIFTLSLTLWSQPHPLEFRGVFDIRWSTSDLRRETSGFRNVSNQRACLCPRLCHFFVLSSVLFIFALSVWSAFISVVAVKETTVHLWEFKKKKKERGGKNTLKLNFKKTGCIWFGNFKRLVSISKLN